MTLPAQLFAGDDWEIPYTAIAPRPTAQLRIHINSPAIQYTSDAVVSETGLYVFEVPKETSATFAPGTYIVAITAVESGKRSTVLTNHVLTVEPNAATASSFSFNRRRVYALRELYEGRITRNSPLFTSMTFNGDSVSKLSMAEIYTELRKAEADLAEEERKAQGNGSYRNNQNVIRVRFPPQ